MAINFTISYTFVPSTTISSSQVNTNFSDNAAVWQGLEALTKSFSNLRVDATPTTSTDVVIKSYADHLMYYRRPVLQFGSTTTVAVESGLDGTAGDIPILFPDGTFRTETSTTRTTLTITRNAVLVTSGAQSGLTGATSETTNTWYAQYACKVTDSTTLWVSVASTVIPTQANFATLNTAYGTNGWVYLSEWRNGDNSSATGDILTFVQVGNMTLFQNVCAVSGNAGTGINLASVSAVATNTYTYAAGTGAAQIPAHLTMAYWLASTTTGAGVKAIVQNAAGTVDYDKRFGTGQEVARVWAPAAAGLKQSNGAAENENMDICLAGYVDGVLGVGSNPVL